MIGISGGSSVANVSDTEALPIIERPFFVGWDGVRKDLVQNPLNQISTREVAFLVLPNFLDVEACKKIYGEIPQSSDNADRARIAEVVERTGTTFQLACYRARQANLKDGTKDFFYFLKSEFKRADDTMGNHGVTVREKIFQVFSDFGYNPSVARDPQFGEHSYPAGLRTFGVTTNNQLALSIHTDDVSQTNPSSFVGGLNHLLAINLYIKMPINSDEGKIIVANKTPQELPANELHKDRYGFSEGLINGTETSSYRPTVGDLVIFNSRLWHGVGPGSETRTAMNGFIGVSEEFKDQLFFWT